MFTNERRRALRVRVPSPAMIIALLALFMAVGGTTYAAINLPANSVGTKHIKNGAVTEGKLKENAVTSAKVKDYSLLAKDFKPGQLPAGSRGLTGPTGAKGDAGPAGAKGDAGPAGVNGTSVLSGPGAPTPDAGTLGDFYIDTTTTTIYGPKSAGGWGGAISLIGPQGPAGLQGPKGDTGSAGSPDTPEQILAKLLQVDGAGSALQSDLLDGLHAEAFQRRGSTVSCPAGQVATAISAEGNLTCVSDANTTYSAGTGLKLTGTVFSLDEARVKAICPTLSYGYAAAWTGAVCMMTTVDSWDESWVGAMHDCASGYYGPKGRLPHYIELVSAARQGLITLTVGEHTADLAGDNSVVYINATNYDDADGVRSRTTAGTGLRCVFAPVQPALGTP